MKKLVRFLPAVLMMGIIFAFSSTPSQELPNFGFWDTLVKKGGHMLGYGLLALAYWYGLSGEPGGHKTRPYVLAYILVILYAISDEFHQSFVPGRHPSWVDVLVFDGVGAIIALGLAFWWQRRKKK